MQPRGNVPSDSTRSLICKKRRYWHTQYPVHSTNEPKNAWRQGLIQLDTDIMDIYDKANDIIVISLPYKLSDIKQTITEFISTNFNDESLLNCFDVALDYLNPNKKDIQFALESDKSYAKINTKFDISKYEEIIQTEAIIVINPKNNDFISIPRDENAEPYTYQDWSKRINFSEISLIGYLCDNGEIVQGDCLRQHPENGRIFVHFNTDAPHFGKKWAWLDTPNERLCLPLSHKWIISWDQEGRYSYYWALVNDFVCEKIAKRGYSNSIFQLTEKVVNWRGRTDFAGVSAVGYRNEQGDVTRCVILKREKERLYLKFENNTKEWISIPNENFCQAPLSRSEEDELVARAIALSLGQAYEPPPRARNNY